jgi:hypothetical protein
MWNGDSLSDILSSIINGKNDINEYFVIYAFLQYSYQNKNSENLLDYLRVVRNLINNTPDNSRREWPRLIPSIENLILDENIYNFLSTLENPNIMQGFSVEQRKEEVFKSKLFIAFPDYKQRIFKIEDNDNFQGNITNMLLAPFADNEDDFIGLEEKKYSKEKLINLLSIFSAYGEMSENDFNGIWGDLINTSLYSQTYYHRLIYDEDYKIHPSLLIFAKDYAGKKEQLSLTEYLEQKHKKFIINLFNKYDSLEDIKDVKEQLYLYYIIQNRIYQTNPIKFFKNNNFNFGWLPKEKGYKSHYINGIVGDEYFETVNPIYQLYNQQFRYNLGINPDNTLDIEIIGGGKRKNPFKLIAQWAKK